LFLAQFVQSQALPRKWCGKLDLRFAKDHNTTHLVQTVAEAPLKVQRPFYPEGSGVCHCVVLHTAGGVVGGDHLNFHFQLQPNAHALITTVAAGKIYRTNGVPAKQTVHIQIDAGATLEFLPQETIVFNGANYRQDLRVELAPDANWLSWEITRFGRTARGERFLQGEWRSHTEVWQQGVPLWIDRQWLPGGEDLIDSPHGLAGQPIVASLVWIGHPVSPQLVEQVRSTWAEISSRSLSTEEGEVGVTRLTKGLVCHYRGNSTTAVKRWFMEVWHLLRLTFLLRSRCTPRVWQFY